LLSASSAVVQYFITYTVKHFGPVVVTVIVSIRQMISVFISSFFFTHTLTPVAMIAMFMAFFVVISRSMRKPVPLRSGQDGGRVSQSIEQHQHPGLSQYAVNMDHFTSLLKCATAIHVLYCFYAVVQEFLTTHTYQGQIFSYPLFLVAATHTGASLFALCALSLQGMPQISPKIGYTVLPAAANFIATFCQHWALYNIFFPTQTLMKSMKVVPVMLIGRLLRNRTYSYLDYAEGILITCLVSYFVYDFQLDYNFSAGGAPHVMLGIFLMLGYIVADSFTSPLEDYIFQIHELDAGQMLLGMELLSGMIAWIALICSGQLLPALQFIYANPSILAPLCELILAAATGAYTCIVTVKLFGPAVFVLLMMSRQTLSLVISVGFFNHNIDSRSCFCLVVVCLTLLVSSIRRAAAQISTDENSKFERGSADMHTCAKAPVH
jgi:adenosine 3'-phospho 5'-phosphosulfate transporter B2